MARKILSNTLVFLWLSPIVLFAAWLSLSSLDLSFGLPFMTRSAHDLVFDAYRQILGIERDALMALIRNALILDAVLLAAIIAWQRRAQIKTVWASVRRSPGGPAQPAG